MAAFPQLEGIIPGVLELPVGDKTYRVKAVDWDTGLFCQAVFNMLTTAVTRQQPATRDTQILDDSEEKQLVDRCLGDDLLAELRADGVPWIQIRHMGMTVYQWTLFGEARALAHWTDRGNLPALNRAARRRRSTSTSTGRASTTQSSASGTNTTSPPTS